MKQARASLGSRTVAGALLLCLPACTATIHRVNGPNIEAEIVGSDSDGLQVASDQGTTYRVSRDSVATIDHPGDVAAVLGAVAIVVGGLIAISAGGDQSRRKAFVPGLAVSSAGFVALLGGLIPYSRSRSAAHAFLGARPPAERPLPADARWDSPPLSALAPPSATEPRPPAPEPAPLSEALLPLPPWTEPDETPAPAPPRPRPVFKPAPPAAPLP